MPILTISENFEGRADDSSSTRVYLATHTNPYASEEEIKLDPLCPKRGNTDPYNPSKIINQVSVERVDKNGPNVLFRIETQSQLVEQNLIDPTTLDAVVTLTTENHEEITCFNADGSAILNKAGDPVYVPVNRARWSFNAKLEVRQLPVWVLSYANAINSSATYVKGLIFPEATLMLTVLNTGEPTKTPFGLTEIEHFTFSFQLHYREETWDVPYPNVGFNALKEMRVPIYRLGPSGRRSDQLDLDAEGRIQYRTEVVKAPITTASMLQGVQEPEALDENGYHIPGAEANDIIRLKSKPYPRRDFNVFGLR